MAPAILAEEVSERIPLCSCQEMLEARYVRDVDWTGVGDRATTPATSIEEGQLVVGVRVLEPTEPYPQQLDPGALRVRLAQGHPR